MADRKRSLSAGEVDGADNEIPNASVDGRTDGFMKFTNKRRKKKLCYPAPAPVKGPRGRPKKDKLRASQPTKFILSKTDSDLLDMIDNSDDCDSYDHCVFCDGFCSSSSSTQCTVYHQYYHLKCCGLEDDLAQYTLRISKFMGWTCEACRLLNTATIKDLQRELASLRITVSSLQSALDNGAGPLKITHQEPS